MTAQGFVFTWRTIMDKRSAATSTLGWDRIERIAGESPNTVVIRLREPFAPLLGNPNDLSKPHQVLSDKAVRQAIETLPFCRRGLTKW